ncbi:hypothetical protein [Sphingosinicella rhizophila]|uniref:Uncharacterized protein n=1 Tax=Sphingosinicella rhizophila TaxID=3050082 RepID=A0ABU3Q980_9SPHN|nr:hypothetical protein [Sphingosinicella sp. GR2756]MDT9599852.1 hypothetical protein [Sphingosinicella sp. GR2756]
MRKFLVPAILISAVAVSAPAAAQYRGGHNQGVGIERQIDQLERQIDRARDRRLITRQEARRLDNQAEYIDRLHDRYRRNGLNQREHHDLQNRINRLRQQFRWERRDGRR